MINFDENGFALESGTITVYVTDEKGIYSHSEDEYISAGTGLSANSYLDAPPKNKKGCVIVRHDNEWVYVEDHRNETVYSVIDKSEIVIDELGEYPVNTTTLKPSTVFDEWNGQKWVISKENQTALLNDNKQLLLTKIANIVDETKSRMLVGYSQAEVESFYKQEQEALAYQADKNASTPMLRQIAENRGVPFEILVQKVIEKSNLFAATIGSVIGQRQAFEDRIEAVTTQEELEEIEREIEQWKN